MKLLQEVNSGLESTYALLDSNSTKPIEFPLLLIVKEVVLDILGINKGNQDTSKLTKKAQKIIDSTDIEEIVGALKTPKQKEIFMKAFDNNPEARFLNLSGILNRYRLKFFEASIKSDEKKGLPSNWRANFNLGKGLLSLGKSEEAIIHLENSVNDAPEEFLVDIYVNLGICYRLLGNFEKAIQCYHTALGFGITNKEFGEICTFIGEVYSYDGNYEEAIKYGEIALDKNPNLDEKGRIYARLGISYYFLGKYEEARDYLLLAYTDKSIPYDARIGILAYLKEIEEVVNCI